MMRPRLSSRFNLLVSLCAMLACGLWAPLGHSATATFSDLASWQAAATSASPGTLVFPTTSPNVGLAEEAPFPPGADVGFLSGVLTWEEANTSLCRTFQVVALEAGAGITFDDEEGAGNIPLFDDALSIGDLNDNQDDDFEFRFREGAPVLAFAFEFVDNLAEVEEILDIETTAGITRLSGLAQIPDSAGGSAFFGVVSDEAILRITFNEATSGDELAIRQFRFDDPSLVDTDNDGFDNCTEATVNGTDPLSLDGDADGLSDLDELNLFGTDPNEPDTDRDGLTDEDELNVHSTNPTIPDSEGDGIPDGTEINVFSSNPLVSDSDLDTLDDGVEVTRSRTQQFGNLLPIFGDPDGESINFARLVGSVDLDGDGDLDFVADVDPVAGLSGPSTRAHAWFENQLNEPSKDFSEAKLIREGTSATGPFVDFDLDGDLDIVGNENGIVWLPNRLNEASSDFGPAQFIGSGPFEFGPKDSADFDGDGDLDILAGSGLADSVVWFENRLDEVTSDFGPMNIITTETNNPLQVYAADIDGDGDPDAVSRSVFDDKIAWYENRLDEPDADFGPQKIIFVNTSNTTIARPVDLDNDGDPDIVASSAVLGGRLNWHENRLNEISADFAPPEQIAAFLLGGIPADLDGDGDPDLLTFSSGAPDDEVGWLENRLTEVENDFGPFRTAFAVSNRLEIVAEIGDFNSNGNMDVLANNLDADNRFIGLRLNPGTNPMLQDSDGDGLDDPDETALGTDGNSQDTDEDGLTDGDEVLVFGSNPNLKDSDNDGTEDGDEVAFGTDPTDAGRYPIALSPILIENPGNPNDVTGLGGVNYAYRIEPFEFLVRDYVSFLNAVGDTDPNGIYDVANESDPRFSITRSGSDGSYQYAAVPGRELYPINFVSFYDSIRLANWLSNGQNDGPQDDTTTEDGAYTITTTGINTNSIVRNPGALVALPSEDEWYKAAYYDATGPTYFLSPASRVTEIICSIPTASSNRANCSNALGDVTEGGSYIGSASPNGTFDQGGNVAEWTDSISGPSRRARGGGFGATATDSSAFFSGQDLDPTTRTAEIGVRLRSVPEPSATTMLFGGIGALCALHRTRVFRTARSR